VLVSRQECSIPDGNSQFLPGFWKKIYDGWGKWNEDGFNLRDGRYNLNAETLKLSDWSIKLKMDVFNMND
jgi:hypothetical protein